MDRTTKVVTPQPWNNDRMQKEFIETVWDYYHEHGRDLPWRQPEPDGTFDPYKIMVSEVMLQQTQVARVIPKYEAFLAQFPSLQSLSAASLADVIKAWSGLGYNRRAKFLWQAAQAIGAPFPDTREGLSALPGIGMNTAGAILAYAYNQPVVFVETNIRTVYIHHFFADRTDVHDKELLPFIEKTLDREMPREWYWALMDYGVFLKSTVGNMSQNSKHYTKQSTFQGSKRQIRGEVLRQLRDGPLEVSKLHERIPDERLTAVLQDLASEKLITQNGSNFYL